LFFKSLLKNYNMKHLTWMVLLLLTAAACRYEQGSGNMETQRRQVDDFSGVSIGGDFDVEIKAGPSPSVSITADDNIIDDIRTTVRSGQLKISLKDGLNPRNVHMKAKITVPMLNMVKASSSARIRFLDELRSDGKLKLGASSAASIAGRVHAPSVVADASSGGKLVLNGQTRHLEVDASSGASVDALDLLSEQTRVETSSGASAKVHASVQLDAKASSGGSIKYRGGPNVNINKSSGGSVGKE
jgi:hypothetical protein